MEHWGRSPSQCGKEAAAFISKREAASRQGERSEPIHRRRVGHGDVYNVWLGNGEVNNAVSGKRGRSPSRCGKEAVVLMKKGRPKADKASEASKPTVIFWEKVVYTVSGWETGK